MLLFYDIHSLQIQHRCLEVAVASQSFPRSICLLYITASFSYIFCGVNLVVYNWCKKQTKRDSAKKYSSIPGEPSPVMYMKQNRLRIQQYTIICLNGSMVFAPIYSTEWHAGTLPSFPCFANITCMHPNVSERTKRPNRPPSVLLMEETPLPTVHVSSS